jgi:hypothetical protein
MKYLGIIIGNKLTFREHITHSTEKCRKIIFALSKSAKLNWGLSHKALKTLYTGGIQPLFLYGAPVWAEILEKTSHRKKLTRVQRLINIKIAKAYRTVSNDTVYNHSINTHSHQNKRNGRTIQNRQRKQTQELAN